MNVKAEYENWLDGVGTPRDDLKSNGGRVPNTARYGAWLRKNDPAAFNVGLQEFKRKRPYDNKTA